MYLKIFQKKKQTITFNNKCKEVNLMTNIMRTVGFANKKKDINTMEKIIPFEEKENFKKKYDCD